MPSRFKPFGAVPGCVLKGFRDSAGLCLLLFTAGCAVVSPRPSGGPLALERTEQDFAEALAHFGQGLLIEKERGPSDPEVLEHFRRAIELDPGRHLLHSRVAVGELYSQHPEEAIAALEASVRKSPGDVEPLLDLATVCQLVGRLDDAAGHYRRALDLQPSATNVYLTLSRLYFFQEKDREALGVLRKGLRRIDEPTTLLAFGYGVGKGFLLEGEMDRAGPCFEFVTRHAVSPEQRRQFLHHFGDLYGQVGADREAIAYYRKALRGPDPFPETLVKLALEQAKTDFEEAVRTLQQAAERYPEDPVVLLALGYMLGGAERLDEAIDVFGRIEALALQSDEQNLTPSFYLYYGDLAHRAGKRDLAVGILERCLAHYPDAHAVLNYLAYTWSEEGRNLGTALEYVTKALDQDPENAAYIDTLGWIYYKQGQYEAALEQIRKAHELLPEDPTIAEHLGDVLDKLGRTDEAVGYWTKSVELAPDNPALVEKLRAHEPEAPPPPSVGP